jgi:hypothetical protein
MDKSRKRVTFSECQEEEKRQYNRHLFSPDLDEPLPLLSISFVFYWRLNINDKYLRMCEWTMKLMTIISIGLMHADAFMILTGRERRSFLRRTLVWSSATTDTGNSIDTNLNPCGVDRVSICFGELCKCQEEENAESIMNDLLARDLPYVVEDAPCLGACGVGSMVSIEYEDGGYDLVTGLQETHDAVGIVSSTIPSEPSPDNIPAAAAAIEQEGRVGEHLNSISRPLDDKALDASTSLEEITQTKKNLDGSEAGDDTIVLKSTPPFTEATTNIVKPETVCKEEDHGAVQRMRDEAKAANEEIPNPWMNMALYLAKKAKESVVGE